MRTPALLGAVFLVAFATACGGAKGLPKGPAPEYEVDPVLDAGGTPAPTELPDAGAADGATAAALP